MRASNPKVKVLSGHADTRSNDKGIAGEWVMPVDGHSTLRKSHISTAGEEVFKLPITSTVISNVRGKSILSQNKINDRRS